MPLKIFTLNRFTCIAGALLLPMLAVGQQAKIMVDALTVLNRIPAGLYGACIEDVNHEIYGGLYGQRIYGESFEEPPASPVITGFTTLGGIWSAKAGQVSVKAGPGYKLVLNKALPAEYSAQISLKFGRERTNAGLLLNVNNARTGADSFDGYEVSVDPQRQMLVLGKHANNWTPLKEVKININPSDWIKLKVVAKTGAFNIYVNDFTEPVAVLADSNSPLKAGKIALRTFGSDVTFGQFSITQNGKMVSEKFNSAPLLQVSSVWDAVNTTRNGTYQLDVADAYNGKQAQVLVHNGGNGIIGVANKGLNRWGIGLRSNLNYQGSVYLKGSGLQGNVTLSLQSADGKTTYATTQLKGITADWSRYEFNLKPDHTDAKARFVISINNKGKLWIDQATLICADEQFKPLPLRADIGTKMQQQGLNFLRYGGTMVNAAGYRWRKMIGPRDKRPPYTGHWYPYSTNGFGIEDFLQFCEAAGFEAAFAINIEETPQDAADLVEYLKGDANTEWGKRRAQNGHPAPYKVKYFEIGNEEVIFNGDVASEYDHYVERFNLLYDAMHAKDASIKFIQSAWWRPESPNMERVFKGVNGKADYWDLHTDADAPRSGSKVDSTLTRMQQLFKQWDPQTKMKCAIFEENGGRHDVGRALGHATTLNAVRRHGEFVLTSCPANALQPFGQNDNGWDQGQIFFTPLQVWGMPPFYSQQMASANHQPLLVKAGTDGDIDVTATRSEDGRQLVIHIVNPAEKPIAASLQLSGFDGRKAEATITQMSGKLSDVNTPIEPNE
ncbi:DUF1080 domain-containing protein [Mucilaginibacter sp. JRF]|uniref:alpha-L-arabinofuranosidase C-terminal domain-containing protein n=1 Tax=Mucilaginibacter sp. JRF TaxID=2780088 RepID=UPI0018825480|nr:alpha-L-arabinofuranosidase C-terminal domain-containing protein [Mucilaginibacter sp. JRF]MBE9583120.1 DUF1080 domain-containing protein [Mucilaginibacter sp. JRF]